MTETSAQQLAVEWHALAAPAWSDYSDVTWTTAVGQVALDALTQHLLELDVAPRAAHVLLDEHGNAQVLVLDERWLYVTSLVDRMDAQRGPVIRTTRLPISDLARVVKTATHSQLDGALLTELWTVTFGTFDVTLSARHPAESLAARRLVGALDDVRLELAN